MLCTRRPISRPAHDVDRFLRSGATSRICDELAPLQLIELHPIPANQIAAYRMRTAFSRICILAWRMRLIPDHSGLIPAALIMGHHLSISALCRAASASGVC